MQKNPSRNGHEAIAALFRQFTGLLQESSYPVLHEVMASLIAELEAQQFHVIVWQGGGWSIRRWRKGRRHVARDWLPLENGLDSGGRGTAPWTKEKPVFLVYSPSREHHTDSIIYEQICVLLRRTTVKILERALGLLVAELLHRRVDIMVWRGGGWTIGKLLLREWKVGRDWLPLTNDPNLWSSKASTYNSE